MTSTIKTVHNKSRRQELRSDDSYIHIMKYMGSKRELLPDIKKSTQAMIPPNSTVLDIFAGTASVGAYLKQDYNIISNDIQHYSQVIAKALIESSSMQLEKNVDSLVAKIEEKYIENKNKLIDLFPQTYAKSNYFVEVNKGEWNEQLKNEYLEFNNLFPSPLNNFLSQNKELILLRDRYFNKNKSVYLQTVFLFSETYFSFEQAMDIDSIKYAIDSVVKNEILKSIFMSALIYAYSYCSSGTGHFAMFRDLKDIDSIEDTFIYRKKRVWDYFLNKLEKLIEYHQYIPGKTYKTFSCDFKELLHSKEMEKVDLIYADPPYSFVHYSRFYHAIESLVKYDYDKPKFKGRYRSDRHQSPFCQKTNVTNAFKILFECAQNNHSHVLLSYSDTGMISLKEILDILHNFNFTAEVHQIKYDHSTLGRKGHKNNSINEYLIQATIH